MNIYVTQTHSSLLRVQTTETATTRSLSADGSQRPQTGNTKTNREDNTGKCNSASVASGGLGAHQPESRPTTADPAHEDRGPRTVKALTTEPHQSSLNQAQASDLTGPRALSCRTCDDAIGTPESRPTRHLRPRPCPAAAPATVHRQGCAAIGCLAHPHRRGRNAKLRQNERKSRISSNGRRPPEASAHD